MISWHTYLKIALMVLFASGEYKVNPPSLVSSHKLSCTLFFQLYVLRWQAVFWKLFFVYLSTPHPVPPPE